MNGFVSYLFAIPKIDVDFSILSSVSEKKMKDCHPSGSGANSRLWIFNHTLSPFYMARWFLRDDVPFRHGSHGAFFFHFRPSFLFYCEAPASSSGTFQRTSPQSPRRRATTAFFFLLILLISFYGGPSDVAF